MLYRHPSVAGVRHSGTRCAECEARDMYGMLWRCLEYVMCAVPSPLSCRSTSCVLYRHPSLAGVRHVCCTVTPLLQESVRMCAVPSPLSYRSPSGRVLYRHPSLTGVRHDVCCTVTPLLQEYVMTCAIPSPLSCRSPSQRVPMCGVRGPRHVRHAVAL